MPANQKYFRAYRFFAVCYAMALAACDASPHSTTDVKSGYVIALGGGGAGAENACISCHGLHGNGDGKRIPYLAGMDRGYLHRQLDDYASGRRPNAVMSRIASRLSAEERARVAEYYAGLGWQAGQSGPTGTNVLFHQGNAKRGIKACATCHGETAGGMGAANPPLARQPAIFVAAQLHAWKRGERQNDAHHTMLFISQSLTVAEIEALSAYVSALPRPHPPPAQATFQPIHHDGPKNGASGLQQRAPE